MARPVLSPLQAAIQTLQRGGTVTVYDRDSREAETDIVIPALNATAPRIYDLRRSAGGLICVALSSEMAEALGLPFMTDILDAASTRFPDLGKIIMKDAPYGDRPAFSLTVNHRSTYTGITDNDRALTIRELALLAEQALDPSIPREQVKRDFAQNFRSPGHLHLLIAHRDLLKARRGHTELSVALAEMAGVTPAMVICEMLDGASGKALGKDEAQREASKRGWPFIEGEEIFKLFEKIQGHSVAGRRGG